MRNHSSLVCQYLENISRDALEKEEYQRTIRGLHPGDVVISGRYTFLTL